MFLRSEHLRSNRSLILDYLFGFRGWGLIIYGALPASLGALGAFKAPDQATLESKLGLAALPFICCVALIPVVLTFALVRQRLANWYLLPDYLAVRAATVTVAIVVISSLVCGANGLLLGTYKLVWPSNWWALPYAVKVRPIAECLLLSFAYLVGASTLFLTVVKEDSDLPLLPNKDEVSSLKLLREGLVGIAKSPLQSSEPAAGILAGSVTTLTTSVDAATTVITKLAQGFTGLGRKRFYDELSAELDDLKAAAQDVGQARLNWGNYWAVGADLTRLDQTTKQRRTRIDRLRGLRLNG